MNSIVSSCVRYMESKEAEMNKRLPRVDLSHPSLRGLWHLCAEGKARAGDWNCKGTGNAIPKNKRAWLAKKAKAMRDEGKTLDAIGREIGYSDRTVYQLIREATA